MPSGVLTSHVFCRTALCKTAFALLSYELPICYTLTVTPFLLSLAMGLMAVSPDLSMAATSEEGCLSSGRPGKCCGLLTVSSVNSVPKPASLMLLGGRFGRSWNREEDAHQPLKKAPAAMRGWRPGPSHFIAALGECPINPASGGSDYVTTSTIHPSSSLVSRGR